LREAHEALNSTFGRLPMRKYARALRELVIMGNSVVALVRLVKTVLELLQ
jgi:hypothetical protein